MLDLCDPCEVYCDLEITNEEYGKNMFIPAGEGRGRKQEEEGTGETKLINYV